MGPAIVVGGVVAAAMFVLGIRLERGPRSPGRRELRYRRALPWVAGMMTLVATLLISIPRAGPAVVLGLVLYAGLAAAAVWRMVTLDRASAWLPPARRHARFAMSIIGLTWLGIVLGLLLWIAGLVADLGAGA